MAAAAEVAEEDGTDGCRQGEHAQGGQMDAVEAGTSEADHGQPGVRRSTADRRVVERHARGIMYHMDTPMDEVSLIQRIRYSSSDGSNLSHRKNEVSLIQRIKSSSSDGSNLSHPTDQDQIITDIKSRSSESLNLDRVTV